MAVVKNITWNNWKGEEISSIPYNIESVGKNIKCGKGEGDGNLEEENLDKIEWGAGKKIKLHGTLYTPGSRTPRYPTKADWTNTGCLLTT